MTATEIHRATEELITYLLATRPDWTDMDIRTAIAGATTIAYGWSQIALGLHRLAFESNGHPRDLSPAYPRQESRPGTGAPASRHSDLLEQARRDSEAATARFRQHASREDDHA